MADLTHDFSPGVVSIVKTIMLLEGALGLIVVICAIPPLRTKFLTLVLHPWRSFDHTPLPRAPDYSKHDEKHWASFPGRDSGTNPAELYPEGEADPPLPESERPVDCFYLYPTTYVGGKYYNAPLTDWIANAGIDICLAAQASAFNRLCVIYAPRYRQCTLAGAYYTTGSIEDRMKGFHVAYADVKTAFEYFLTNLNRSRPFIIAAHSQGTRLAARLIAEVVEGSPHRDRFIGEFVWCQWLTSMYPCTCL